MKEKEDINEYIVVPDKYIDQIIKIFHKNNGHTNIQLIIFKKKDFILRIYIKYQTFINNCIPF